MENFKCIQDFKLLAEHVMTENASGYINSGSNSEECLRQNELQIKAVKINPSILVDVSNIDMTTSILGSKVQIPFGIAPTAMHCLTHPLGEKNAIRAAQQFDTFFTLSTLSTNSIQEVCEAAPGALKIFQLYVTKDRSITEKIVRAAELNGFKALALTVDAPILGKRERDTKNKFNLPSGMRLEILESLSPELKMSSSGGSGLLDFFAKQIDSSLTWDTLIWLKSITKLPIILKGIQSGADAQKALELGFRHLWVTNHGGRQLDSVRSTIEFLPEVVEAVKETCRVNKIMKSQVEVYCDGGVRYGEDIFKMLALGADFVFLGRPLIWGNACGGQKGQEKVLEILKQELKMAMMIAGAPVVKKIDQKFVINPFKNHYKL